jgi:PAS domain S-box-containing protein
MDKLDNNILFRELFSHANESIVVVDNEGFIQMINPAAENYFGYTSEELKNKKVESLIPDNVANRHAEQRNNYTAEPRARKMGIGFDLHAKRKDNTTFPVEISLSPFVYHEKNFVIAFIIDITQRKAIENEVVKHQLKLELLTKELKVTNEKLEMKVQDRTKVLQEALYEIEKSRSELKEALEKEKQLNELKSRFLSMASHEFRTPLTTILSSATLIAEYPLSEQNDKRIKHVERISSAVNNLNAILTDFLSLSKIEEGKVDAVFKEFNIKHLIVDLIDELKGIYKKGQTVNFSHSGSEIISLDPKLLKNILVNLISNAIKFSDENKTVEIEVKNTQKTIIMSVADAGIGISKEDKEHLFQRFFRGQNATNIQGTGLGLNIVAKFVELMNGSIHVETEINKGTTFILRFKKEERA